MQLIEGGNGGYGNPCTTGFHMYFNAEINLANAIAEFILKNSGAVD